ncbi:MAG: OB-fold domain-containing protein [Limnohabitans sp.]|uniref:Zn-ribbon domain-containing OB-fold protein n=1 Tax=Limnohabitans sp. TaxID=1907725 RepID=UPI003BAF7757
MRKIPAPRVLPESLPFWQAADEGRYLVKKCNSCGQVHHYPRDICPFCLSADTVWQDSPGTGVLYSFSTMGQGDAAYTMAYVTLDEGVTVMSNLVDCDPSQVRIGQKVRVVFTPTEGGHAVPMFTPV